MLFIFTALLLGLSGCTKDLTVGGKGCTTALTGTSWVPNVPQASDSHHDATVEVTETVISSSGSLTGLAQATGAGKEISVTIDMSTDLGDNGSLTLMAEMTSFPTGLVGGAFPMLVSLHDGTNELVNLKRTGAGNDCWQSGYFTCSGGSCSENTNCTLTAGQPSSFVDRRHWQQYQIPPFGYVSTNVFPTCDWGSGTPACSYNSNFFSSGKLRSGGNYTAKYVLLASNYSSLTGFSGSFRVHVIKKKDTSTRVTTGSNGAIDLNIVLVGTSNIQASRTDKGKQNLDALFGSVADYFAQDGSALKLGALRVFEWTCEMGGDAAANTPVDSLESVFQQGSSIIPSEYSGNALNVFMVSSVPLESSSNSVILGVAGAIGGPLMNGTGASGLAFSSFDFLDTFNPDCDTTCNRDQQEEAFIDMGGTITHEIGHYLGLNHPNESSGTRSDYIPDTPTCGTTGGVVTINSCRAGAPCSTSCGGYDGVNNFCPTTQDCQFNHVMWWTTKNYKEGTMDGDGNVFSANSGVILNYSPWVR